MAKLLQAKVLLFLPNGSPIFSPCDYDPFNIPDFIGQAKKLTESVLRKWDDDNLQDIAVGEEERI